MNELDVILIAIILAGIVVGWRRGLVRVFISIAGIYVTVIVAGYVYKPMGDTLAEGFGRLGIGIGTIGAHNFSYLVAVIVMTVVVELTSRNTFEETRIGAVGVLDNVLGAVVGVFYGMLWASLFLVPSQYSVARESSSWSTAVFESALVPTLNRVFQNIVLNVVSIFFIGGVPELYRNHVSQRVAYLFQSLTSLRFPFV
jgi:uncharacterized membrane protein required for colicin V production